MKQLVQRNPIIWVFVAVICTVVVMRCSDIASMTLGTIFGVTFHPPQKTAVDESRKSENISGTLPRTNGELPGPPPIQASQPAAAASTPSQPTSPAEIPVNYNYLDLPVEKSNQGPDHYYTINGNGSYIKHSVPKPVELPPSFERGSYGGP
jgi:hypothetical protein